ncbi:MAG: cytochrome c5 family protein [Rhodocyclales bacterium]|nr:cytochrome c5 family protein [Rhodocyclales bacterium]
MSRKHFVSVVLTGVMALSTTFAIGMASQPKGDEEATLARIKPLARVEVAGGKAGAPAAGGRSGEELYKAVCMACHDAGVAGAPKIGDKAAWTARIGVGLDVLVKSARAGKNAMPPKGGSDASDEELTRVVAYMANKSGANFKLPAAGEKIASNERSGEQIAQAVCLKCHETGEKGAPKISDKAAWTQRASKGIDGMAQSVIRGHGNMPARGGLTDVSDAELKNAIAFLVKQVGSDIK